MLDLKLIRKDKAADWTLGDIYIDGHLFCNTLEDTVRKDGIKIAGKTAIPAGRYEVRLTYSNRFKQVMPQLLNVPNFEGIRIHPGNTAADTEGCILVGRDGKNGMIYKSRDTYNDLMDELEKEKDLVYITIL